MTPGQLSDSRWLVGLHKGRSEDETPFAVLCLGRLLSDYDALAAKLLTADAALHEICGESTESNIVKIAEIALGIYDPSPWCSGCSAMRKTDCRCGELASND